METPLQTANRLLGALEDFVSRETTLLGSMDFVEAVDLQERAAPLIDRLCSLAPDPAVAVLRDRVEELVERRARNYDFLERQLRQLQADLRRVNDARNRINRIGPAYSTLQPIESQLNTAA